MARSYSWRSPTGVLPRQRVRLFVCLLILLRDHDCRLKILSRSLYNPCKNKVFEFEFSLSLSVSLFLGLLMSISTWFV